MQRRYGDLSRPFGGPTISHGTRPGGSAAATSGRRGRSGGGAVSFLGSSTLHPMRLPALLLAVLLTVPGRPLAGLDGPPVLRLPRHVAGDTLRGEIQLKDPIIGRAHIVLDGERREIEEVREVRLDGETLAVVDGRRFARLVEDGRVRLYSREVSTPAMMTPGPGPNGGMVMSGGQLLRDRLRPGGRRPHRARHGPHAASCAPGQPREHPVPRPVQDARDRSDPP